MKDEKRQMTLLTGNIIRFLTALALTGCAVGPDFHAPAAPSVKTYTAGAVPDKTAETSGAAGLSQRFISGQDIPREWWKIFRSKELDGLLRQAFDNSPTLILAKARLREAQENRNSQFGSLFPGVDANLSASRQKLSGASFGQPDTGMTTFNLINASVNVSYSLDLFGSTRRKLEALQAQIDYQQYQQDGAYLTLASNIVTTAVKEASLRAQGEAIREIIDIQRQVLLIIENRYKIGGVSLADVLAQRTALAQSEAMLPPLERDLARTRNQLAVLTGSLPSEAAIPEFSLDSLQLPQDLPVSLPSVLVRQRPDIKAAEAMLHTASAGIGVATANLFPQMTLSASLGSQATTAGSLFDSSSVVWSLGAGLLQPIFHGGALKAKRRAAIAVYDQAQAQYREVILESFQNVADTLHALATDALTLKAQTETEELARTALTLAKEQFQAGAVSYLLLLGIERQYQESRINLIQARASRFADTAALFQALGGGWGNHTAEMK